MSCFSIDKQTPIVLCGCGGHGKKFYHQLTAAGFRVIGFLDKKPISVEPVSGLPVFHYDEVGKNAFFSQPGLVFIVTFSNHLWHSAVAEQLHLQGADRILFVPYRPGYEFERRQALQERYFSMVGGEYDALKRIPGYAALTALSMTDASRISGDSRHTTAWVSLYSLFVVFGDKRDEYMQAPQYEEYFLKKWSVKIQPYAIGGVYQALFELLNRGAGEAKLYLSIFMDETNQDWGIFDLGARQQYYDFWEEQYHFNRDYFLKNPSIAQVAPQGQIIVLDGNHRAIFLMDKGMEYIPLKFKTQEYERLLNRQVAEKCFMRLKKLQIERLPGPVLNPYFMRFPHRYEKASRVILKNIVKPVFRCITSSGDAKVICAGFLAEFFSRYLYKIGYRDITRVHSGDVDLEQLFDELQYVSGIADCKTLPKTNDSYAVAIIAGGSAEGLQGIDAKLLVAINKQDEYETILPGLEQRGYFAYHCCNLVLESDIYAVKIFSRDKELLCSNSA